jgi:hypothetical protein
MHRRELLDRCVWRCLQDGVPDSVLLGALLEMLLESAAQRLVLAAAHPGSIDWRFASLPRCA